MLCFKLFCLFASSLTLVKAAPAPEHYIVHERRESLRSSWIKRDRLPPTYRLPIRIALIQSDLENAERHLMSVSHPGSPEYGQHWSKDRIIDTFRPSELTESQVRQWLIDHGIEPERIKHSADKSWFSFHADVDEAEALLRTEFHQYEHTDTGMLMPSCEEYHLPSYISPHIEFVHPGTSLPDLSNGQERKNRIHGPKAESLPPLLPRGIAQGSPKTDVDTCPEAFAPACVAAAYQIPPAPEYVHPNNSMGIYESDLEFWLQSDLDTFFGNYTDIPNGTHPIAANIDGGQQSANSIYYAGTEVELDLTIAYPIVYPQKIVEYQVDDFVWQSGLPPPQDFVQGFDTFLDALDGSFCNFTAFNQTGNGPYDPVYPDPYGGWQGDLECGTAVVTNVISISYGAQEVDVPLSYQKRQCLEFLKLGLQGVSILVSTGDAGAANFPPEFTSLSPGCLGENGTIYNPTWPNNCPWVTAVGATRLYPGQSINDSESTLARPAINAEHPTNFSGGGGFSNIYPRPAYQRSAVAEYFNSHDPGYPYYSQLALNTSNITKVFDPDFLAGRSGGIYNRIGRGYPDVSAAGLYAPVIIGGEWQLWSGTSMSTPLFGAIINRINEERLHANKTTLGFLNPALYSNPSMLNDITNGSNYGCIGQETAYTAVPGWDPATGLGTPNYPKMLEYFMNLP